VSCSHVRRQSVTVPVLGGSFRNQEVLCALKLSSTEKKLEVYGELFRRGLEGSTVGTTCPVANGSWSQCPFRDPY